MIVAYRKSCRQRGLSLIELMIALALGIIIVAAMTELFVNLSSANNELAKTNSQIENARYTLQYIENDAVHAGYLGGFLPQWDDFAWEDPLPYTSVVKPDPCLAFGSWTAAYENSIISIPVQVFSDLSSPATTCLSPGLIDASTLQAGSDVLVVRHVDTTNDVAGDPNDTLYFQVANCETEIGTTPYVMSEDPNDLVLTELDCTTETERRKWVQNIYYVRNYAVTPGDGIPTLMRSSFGVTGTSPSQQPGEPIVEGIERFNVDLGFDRRSHTGELVDNSAAILWADPDERIMPRNRGNGVVEGRFERCLSNVGTCTAADLSNVVALRLNVLSRAIEPSLAYTDDKTYSMGAVGDAGPFNDSFKRHVFSTTVRLNNVSGRRDTPYDPNGI